MSKTVSNPLHDLPIDQYSRQRWASNIIDVLSAKKKTPHAILDVGGYKGKTAEFRPKDTVVICDLFDVNEPGYVKGDGRRLPFEDNSFDFVVTFDTYEHVPRNGRESFVRELSRVAKSGVILAAPFDDMQGVVSKAEVDLNEYHKDLYDKDHPWLKEHIDYKISTPAELDKIVSTMKYGAVSMPSNEINAWVLMQTIYFSIELDEDLRGRVDDINRFYNKNLESLDVGSVSSYRKIYFLSDNQLTVKKVETYFTSIKKKEDAVLKESFFAMALTVFGKKYRDIERYKNYLEGEVERLKGEVDSQNALLAEKGLTHYPARIIKRVRSIRK